MTKSKYTQRFLARVVLEAVSPLAIGNGEKNIMTDALVATDVNGLPYIPGTALAGVVRHALEYNGIDVDNIFGFQSNNGGKGSEIIFTEARMIGKDGLVVDGLQDIKFDNAFYPHFKKLPIRQHVRIGHKGTTENTGKFDEQVAFKGTRFVFEIEVVTDGSNLGDFNRVIQCLKSETLRVGGGSRSGFGEVRIIDVATRTLDLAKPKELNAYIEKSSGLSESAFWGELPKEGNVIEHSDRWIKYELNLKPEDFFLFGSGFGDADADMTPVKESIIVWEDGKPEFKEDCILIPASSLKGALAHRTAFYYNKNSGVYADKLGEGSAIDHVGKNNTAVKELFGSEGIKNESSVTGQLRGNVLFSDIIENKEHPDKLLNHVKIDRFTGGAIDGAKFDEKVVYTPDASYTTSIYVLNKDYSEGVIAAFEDAIRDVCIGMLPLGGGVNRGNGTFSGSCIKNDGQEIKQL